MAMRYSVFNPEGESYVPETERFAAERGDRMRDFQMREALMKQQNDQYAGNEDLVKQQLAQQLLMGGTAADKRAHEAALERSRQQALLESARITDTGATTRQNLANQPAMAEYGLKERLYADQAPIRQQQVRRGELELMPLESEAQLKQRLSNMILQELAAGDTGGSVPGAPAGVGAGVSAAGNGPAAPGAAAKMGKGLVREGDLRGYARKLMGFGEDPDEAFARTMRERAYEARMQADPEHALEIAEASATGGPLPKINSPFNQQTVTRREEIEKAIQPTIQSAQKLAKADDGEGLSRFYYKVMQELRDRGASPEALKLADQRFREGLAVVVSPQQLRIISEFGLEAYGVKPGMAREDFGSTVRAATGDYPFTNGSRAGAADLPPLGW